MRIRRFALGTVVALTALLVGEKTDAGVTASITTVTATPNVSTVDQVVTLQATVTGGSGTPAGNVVFTSNNSVISDCGGSSGLPLSGAGSAFCRTQLLPAGSDTIVATFQGDVVYDRSSSSPCVVAVSQGSTTTTVAPSTDSSAYGAAVTLSATVSPSGAEIATDVIPLGGTVSFSDSGTAIAGCAAVTVTFRATGTATATCSTQALAAGAHSITAAYGGDSNYLASPSSAPAALTVTRASPLITWPTPTAIRYGTALSSTQLAATANVPGTFTYDPPAGTLLGLGPHTLSASFTPADGKNYLESTASVELVVTPLPPTTTTETVSATPSSAVSYLGSSVTFWASVAGASGGPVPTGTVSFTSGSTVLGGGTLDGSGMASFSTSSLTPGSYSLEANYGGDSNYSGSSSAASSLNVVDFELAADPATITVPEPGQIGQTTLTIAPLGGFEEELSYSCSGLPAESSCTFAAVSPTSETVTIETTAPSVARVDRKPGAGGWALAAMLPGVLGLAWMKGRRRKAWCGWIVVTLMWSIPWLSACGGGSNTSTSAGTPTGTSQVTVTATTSGAAPLTHQVVISLTVR